MADYNAYTQNLQDNRPPRISLNTVPVGSIIAVRGKVNWSHISTIYEGDELAQENKRRSEMMRTAQPLPPHTRLSIDHCEVMEQDPNNPSPFGQYMNGRLWTSAKHPELGRRYDAISKLQTPPEVLQANADGTATPIKLNPGTELATGLDVTIFLRVYKSKNVMNNGISVNSIVVNEPLRTYDSKSNNAVAKTLEAYGLTIKKDETITPSPDPANAPAQAPAPAPMQAPAPATMPAQNNGIVAPPAQGPIMPPPGAAGIQYSPENDPSKLY